MGNFNNDICFLVCFIMRRSHFGLDENGHVQDINFTHVSMTIHVVQERAKPFDHFAHVVAVIKVLSLSGFDT